MPKKASSARVARIAGKWLERDFESWYDQRPDSIREEIIQQLLAAIRELRAEVERADYATRRAVKAKTGAFRAGAVEALDAAIEAFDNSFEKEEMGESLQLIRARYAGGDGGK